MIRMAHSFIAAFCDNDDCGLHLTAMDQDGNPIVEIVMNPNKTIGLMEFCKDQLYAKAVRKDKT